MFSQLSGKLALSEKTFLSFEKTEGVGGGSLPHLHTLQLLQVLQAGIEVA